MRNFFEKILKYFKKIKRDGFLKASKKALIKLNNDYINKINPIKIIKFNKNKKRISIELDKILKSDYDRVLVWRSSIGWNIPLFQRPQHLSNHLSKNKCLVFYEVTKMTDEVDFLQKQNDNLYLVNFETKKFLKLLHQKLEKISKPKYIFIASTSWDLDSKTINEYTRKGFKILYDYLDELSPDLAGIDKLPRNVEEIHNYVIKNISNAFVVCTADVLYNDMLKKRKTDKNLTFACNGVTYEHFTNLNKDVKLSNDFEEILNQKKPIIGYYGALAKWFDYKLIKKIAKERPNYNIVLIGAKYDTSFDKENLEKYKNIYFLGSKKFDELPYYAKHFNVCTLPFLLNDITKATSPIKVFEYMALGKPIISTDLLECRKYKSIKIAKNEKEFIKLCDDLKDIKDKEYFKQLKIDVLNNTWESKAKTIINGLKNFENDDTTCS